MVDTAPESASFPLAEYPRLRPIEVFPIQDRVQRGLVLRDPADPRSNPIVVADGAAEVLMLLDGRRTLPELSAALASRGAGISESQLRRFLGRLDEAGFLEGPRANYRFQQRKARFLAQPFRPAVHAGGAYPDGAEDLPRMLAAGYVHADGPGSLPGSRNPRAAALRAVIAPHVDLHRGAPTYSWAYKALAEAQPADLYVVLGTCHTPVEGHFAVTGKAYETPLGQVPADADFVARLAANWDGDPFAGEFSHAGEHSIEFQAVYLRSLGLASETAAPIVPILCDSLHGMVPYGKLPRDVGLVASFVDALQRTLAEDGRRITLIAAVDLAHIGPRFGDRWSVDANHQARVGEADRDMLEALLRPDADAFYADVMRDRDARRICGFTPIYLLTALMQAEQRRGELLRYTQWVDTDLSSSVTFASAVFR
ncbi:MAG TPA: AmmeMemoRadiSam system protein B [Chloroflexota bacterium]